MSDEWMSATGWDCLVPGVRWVRGIGPKRGRVYGHITMWLGAYRVEVSADAEEVWSFTTVADSAAEARGLAEAKMNLLLERGARQ